MVPGSTFGSGFRVRGVRVLTTVGLVMAVPAAALACPVCGLAGTADNHTAYAAMTALMSGVPLVMIGGVVFWVVRRAKK